MSKRKNRPEIPLPRGWPGRVKSAMLHIISLAKFALAYTRGWAVNSPVARVRLKADNERLRQQIALLTEEIRIKNARIKRIPALNRPHYMPTERMAILELRAARAWSTQQTADVFLVTAATISSWMKRLDEQGADALVQIREPVNKFPDFVRYAVQRLKALCPSLGKAKIAEILCRASLHLGATRRTARRHLSTQGRRMPMRQMNARRLSLYRHAEDAHPSGGAIEFRCFAQRRFRDYLGGLR